MGHDVVAAHALHDHQLLPAGGAGDESDRPPGDPQLVREQPQECLVRRPLDRRCRDPRAQHADDDAVDMV